MGAPAVGALDGERCDVAVRLVDIVLVHLQEKKKGLV